MRITGCNVPEAVRRFVSLEASEGLMIQNGCDSHFLINDD